MIVFFFLLFYSISYTAQYLCRSAKGDGVKMALCWTKFSSPLPVAHRNGVNWCMFENENCTNFIAVCATHPYTRAFWDEKCTGHVKHCEEKNAAHHYCSSMQHLVWGNCDHSNNGIPSEQRGPREGFITVGDPLREFQTERFLHLHTSGCWRYWTGVWRQAKWRSSKYPASWLLNK